MANLKWSIWGLVVLLCVLAYMLSGCRSRMQRWREYKHEQREHFQQRIDQWRDYHQQQRDKRWGHRKHIEGEDRELPPDDKEDEGRDHRWGKDRDGWFRRRQSQAGPSQAFTGSTA